jgi:filamentous hemagglutinin
MINAVHASGAKISAQDVVHIWPLGRQIPGVHPNTQHAWLETGNDRSGMQHIVNKHGPAFAQQGIPNHQLPHLAEQATRHGEIMGTQGRSRTIYKTDHQGSTHHVAVETANNGYVVSMNPSSEASAKKAAKKWKGFAGVQQNQPGPSSGNPGATS